MTLALLIRRGGPDILVQNAQTAINTFALLKNVTLDPERHSDIAPFILRGLSPWELNQLAARKSSGVAALTRAASGMLDTVVMSQIAHHLDEMEGMKGLDLRVFTSLLADIDRVARIAAEDQAIMRWPDIATLVERYFAEPRGPLVTAFFTGDVLTTFWQAGKLHRNPKDGPAWHCIGPTSERTEYRVEGKWHRDHRDGPALIDRNFEGTGIRIEEYHWHGQVHRPSAEGPALLYTDATGHRVLEIYVEDDVEHRNPPEGPSHFEIEGDKKLVAYKVRGLRHRPETDGPARTVTDLSTGVVLEEEYYWEGDVHRTGGPALIMRHADGSLDSESWYRHGSLHRDGAPAFQGFYEDGALRAETWWRNGLMHREPQDGPAAIDWNRDGTVGWQKYCVDGEFIAHPDTVEFKDGGELIPCAFESTEVADA